MPESNIDIIIKSKQEGNGAETTIEDLQNMSQGLTNVEKAMAGTRSTIAGLDSDIKVFGTNLGSTADLLGGMGISIPVTPMQLFGQALATAKNFIDGSIESYSQYVDEMDKLAQFTGMTIEESSRLYQVSDDLRINTNSLELALRTMAQNGLIPSIEGLAQLSDQYTAIQDPVTQAQFLIDQFGSRAGAEMARMMGIGGDAIRTAAAGIDDYMVVTGKSRDEVDQYLQTQDKWEETLGQINYMLATAFLPVLTDLLNLIMDTDEENQNGVAQWMRYIPVLSQVREAFIFVRQVMGLGTDDIDTQANAINSTANAWDNATNAAKTYNGYVSGTRGNLSDRPGYGSIYDEGYVHPTYSAPTGSGRAQGGEVFPGVSYPVGERQVEMFTPSVPGYISPSAQPQQNIIFNYQPAVSLADEAEAQRVLTPYIMEALRSKGLSYGY
jgi:hypothetical protein